jgi:hypothetical protein
MFNTGPGEHDLFQRDERTEAMRGLRWTDVAVFQSTEAVDMVELLPLRLANQ